MSAATSNKDKMMAANLRSKGIFHGRRLTTTHSIHPPSMKDVGSAAYRRLRKQKAEGGLSTPERGRSSDGA